MKKTFAIFIVALTLVGTFASRTYALSENQSVAIETLLNESTRMSGAPGMSVSIIDEGETYYISSGYADREKRSLPLRIPFMSWPRLVRPLLV